MLTVMREMAAQVATELAHMPDAAPRRRRRRRASRTRVIADVLERAIAAGRGVACKRGPELLPVLREAGVVDAGGYGVTVMFAGVVAALRGERGARARAPPPPARVTHPEHASARPTATARTSPSPATASTPAPFVGAARGARRLGARRRRRAHAEGPRPHRRARARDRASSPAPARSRASTSPTCTRRSRSATGGSPPPPARGPRARCGALAVVARRRACRELFDGARRARRSTAAPTLNPSTYELLAGIHAVPAEEVVVLPEQPERRHGRRARRRAVREGRPRRADALAAGGPGGRGRARRPTAARPRTPPRCATRSSACAPAASRPPRARTPQGRFARRRRRRLRRARSSSPGASPRRRCATVLDALARRRRAASPCIAGDGAPLDDDAVARARARRRRARVSRRRPAGLVVAARGRVAPDARRARADRAGGHDRPRADAPFASRDEPDAPRRCWRAPVRWPRPVGASSAPLDGRARAKAAAARRGARACETVGDLLEHLPRDRREARTVGDARARRDGDGRRRGPRDRARARCAGAA